MVQVPDLNLEMRAERKSSDLEKIEMNNEEVSAFSS